LLADQLAYGGGWMVVHFGWSIDPVVGVNQVC
jgi:hypothetical protein